MSERARPDTGDAPPGLAHRVHGAFARDRGFWIYLAARVAAGIGGLIVVKLAIELMSRTEYGTWGALTALSGLLIPVVTLSTPSAMLRLYFDCDREDREGQSRMVRTGFTLCALSVLLLWLGTAVSWLAFPVPPPTLLYVALVTSGAVLMAFFHSLARMRDDRGVFCFNLITDRLGFALLLGAALVVSHQRAQPLPGLLWATLLFAAAKWGIVALNVALYTRRRVIEPLRPLLSRRRAWRFLSFSGPRAATYLVGWALVSSDTLLLHELSTPFDTADYFFALGIARLVAIITQAALTDWPTFYYTQMRDAPQDRDALIAARARRTLWVHAAGAVLLRLSAEPIYWIYGAEDYAAGLSFIGMLILANQFFLLGNLFASGIGHAKKTHLGFLAMALPAALNIGLNLWLIPIWGAPAAAATTLGAYLLYALLAWWIGRRFYRFSDPLRLLWPVLVTSAVSLAPLPRILMA